MLRLTGKHPVLEHLLAFTVAWVVASWLFIYVLRPITVPQPTPGFHVDTVGKGETAVRNLVYLSSALRGDKTVVVLGSSELDSRWTNLYMPNVFLPEHHLARVFTYGQAGFETLAMYGLLQGVRPHLNGGTRLVILLSPVWFRYSNLWAGSFVENFNDNLLLQIYWSDEARGVFHDYINDHRLLLNDMTSTQSMYLDDPSSIIDWGLPGFIARTINARAYAQREKLNLWLGRLGEPADKDNYDAGNGKDLPWDEYEQTARAHEVAKIGSNALWLHARVYRNYMSAGGYRKRTLFSGHLNPEPEMDGIKLLLQLLRRSKVKALFIMQPVNPRLYDDLAAFDPIDARVASLCREYGMGYMDMYTMPFQKGELQDSMHPGELGWEMIDRKISEYFSL